jgi:hypothetical protein
MKVRETTWFSWSIAMAAIFSQSLQAADGRPSQQTLAAMGLGGMTILSDDEATSIRGFGWKGGNGGHSNSFAAASGNSFADIVTPFGSAHSENQYAAQGKHFAGGANGSHAGVEIKISGGHKGGKKSGGNHGNNTKWGGKGGMKMGGGYGMKPPRNGGHNGGGNHGGGKTKVLSFKVFAGGFSFAKSH